MECQDLYHDPGAVAIFPVILFNEKRLLFPAPIP
jgi:hypothetical protein